MRIERGQLPPGPIESDLQLYGQIAGDASVANGVHLDLFGQVAGSLTVEPGASVSVYGMVCGDLINRGEVRIDGTVTGSLLDDSGQAQVAPGAVIAGA